MLLNSRRDSNFLIQHSSTHKLLNMDYYGLSLLIASLLTGVSCEGLTAVKDEEFRSEGSSVTLSYNYSNKIAAGDYVFWYRQYPGKSPEFLISHLGSGQKLQNPVPGFSFEVSGDKTQMDLQISSAAVTDSAVLCNPQ
ncbi:hypothetical protein CHARACLAT_033556 [Characodon lateralis]|uniref:Immunoglobulin V-set domain-containing protein n=1 Tax=Characodon lateralis TaxID=208331 RepID=A0ABU7F1H0_9TELE|nr:hypothetical protein [Characodon lateralis]